MNTRTNQPARQANPAGPATQGLFNPTPQLAPQDSPLVASRPLAHTHAHFQNRLGQPKG